VPVDARPDPQRPEARFRRLHWYAHRLRAMSPAELAHRLRELARRRLYRARPPDPADLLLPGAHDMLPDLAELRSGLAELAATTPLAGDFARRAEALARGELTVFGRPWSCMNPERSERDVPGWHGEPLPVPDWHWTPDSASRWPEDRYCFDIPYRHAGTEGCGDVKFVWELNRLTYLQPVAAHAFLSGEAHARRLCIQHLWNWAERNPPFLGVNWASGIELAIRCVSLVIVISLLDPRTLPLPLRVRLANLLAAHGCWLACFPSRHSSANNHLVAELAGLFLLGSLFPGLRPATAWAAAGRAGLEEEIGRQILDDGAGAEQSPAYAGLSMEWFALAAQVARLCGTPFSAPALDRLALGAAWLRAIADRRDQVPDIGDADGSSLFAPEVPQALYPAAVRGMVAQVTGRPDLAPLRVTPGLRHALTGLPRAGAAEPDGLRSFPDGGLTVMRWRNPAGCAEGGHGEEVLLLLDHGPLGYLSIAAHGHADALSVWLHLDGRPVLADAGTWLYFGAGAWRDHFRSTAAHNTLALAGSDSSRMAGPFNWRSRAVARLVHAAEAAQGWQAVAEHDGYLAEHGFRHRRTLRRDSDRQVTLLDELTGRPDATAPVEIGFQFAPDLDLAVTGTGWLATRAGRPILHLRHDGGLVGSVAAGAVDPPRGWVSPCFGEKRPAPRLGFRGAMRAGEAQAFILSIGKEVQP